MTFGIKTLLVGLAIALLGMVPARGGYFTAGDLVIDTVSSSTALSSAATQVNLAEYSTSGSLVQTIAVTSTTSGGNNALTDSGTATSDGALTLSPNGQYLSFAGYSAPVGASSVVNSNVARTVGVVGANGVVDTSTLITDGYVGNGSTNGNNIRGAVTTNGTTFYTAGASGVSGNGGTREVGLGSTGASTQISTTVTNTRVSEIFGNQLYVSASSGSNVGISMVGAAGAGLPTTGGQAMTLITSGGGSSPYAFLFLGSSHQYLFVADSVAGIEEFTNNGSGLYTLTATYDPQGLSGLTGLTGTMSGNNFVLYSTNPAELVEITGNAVTGVSSFSSSVLATAAANTAFRGIAFAPAAVPEPASIVLVGLGIIAASAVAARRQAGRAA